MVISAPVSIATSRADNNAPRPEYLEGLRALAALWVLLSHLWISQMGQGAHSGPLGLASNWLLYSHLAVDVFIVLSGYCLFLPVRRDSGLLRGGPPGFFRRRARRILPPYFFALTLAVAISLVLERLDGAPWRLDVRALGVNLLLLQDVILRGNVFDGPLWSVAVEWRLSLVFPLLVWGLRHAGRTETLLAAGIVGYGLTAFTFWLRPAGSLLMSSPWYLLLFTMGLCAASLAPGPAAYPQRERSWGRYGWLFGIAVAATALVMLVWRYPVTAQGGIAFGRHMPLIDAATGALTALVLIGLRRAFDRPLAATPHLLSWPPLAALGRFSYSLYLTHEPFVRVLVRLMDVCPALKTAPSPVRFCLLLGGGTPLLIGLAYLFFLYCERPFMSSRRVRRRNPAAALALS